MCRCPTATSCCPRFVFNEATPCVPDCREPHGLPFLHLATAGKADALVGGDGDLLALLLQVESITTGLLDTARGVFGLALIAALVRAMAAVRARDMLRHRAWMIRAYAIGMGQGTVALVMFPIYLITGEPPTGLATDIVVVGMWLFNIALGEWVARRLASPRPLQPVITVPQPVQRRGKAQEARQGGQQQRKPR